MLTPGAIETLLTMMEEHRKSHSSVYLLLMDPTTFGLPSETLMPVKIESDIEHNRQQLTALTGKNLQPLMYVAFDVKNGEVSYCYGGVEPFEGKPEIEPLLAIKAEQFAKDAVKLLDHLLKAGQTSSGSVSTPPLDA